jgi:hypothetical protein
VDKCRDSVFATIPEVADKIIESFSKRAEQYRGNHGLCGPSSEYPEGNLLFYIAFTSGRKITCLLTVAIAGTCDLKKCNAGWSEAYLAGTGRFARKARQVIVFKCEGSAVQLDASASELTSRDCVALAFEGHQEVERTLLVCIDDQQRHPAWMLSQAVSVNISILGRSYFGIQHCGSHQLPPKQGCPVVRSGLERILVEQPVVARSECIVHDDLHASTRQTGVLDHISKCIEEG